MHILALHYAWWERRMRDNGKEDARKRGGRINEGGRIHDTNSFDVKK